MHVDLHVHSCTRLHVPYITHVNLHVSTSLPGRHILRNYTCSFGVYGVCRAYTKISQKTPFISGVFLEVAFEERVKLVYFTSDVYLV